MFVIGLGANIPSVYGAPEDTIRASLKLLEERGIIIEAVSAFYHSAPVPISSDPWFCNAVARVNTTFSPDELLTVLLEVEELCGRVRGEKNAPRTLDLDLLAYEDVVSASKTLTLPHPRLHERAFVLKPLVDIDPAWQHPVLKQSVKTLLEQISDDQEITVLK